MIRVCVCSQTIVNRHYLESHEEEFGINESIGDGIDGYMPNHASADSSIQSGIGYRVTPLSLTSLT